METLTFLFENTGNIVSLIVLIMMVFGKLFKIPGFFKDIKQLRKDVNNLMDVVKKIIPQLPQNKANKILNVDMLFKTESPKKITEKGWDFIKKNNIDKFVFRVFSFKNRG